MLRGHCGEQWNVRRVMVIIAVECKGLRRSIPATRTGAVTGNGLLRCTHVPVIHDCTTQRECRGVTDG